MQDNELDRILDGALAGYSDATPLAGLEQRVLNRIGSGKRNRRWLRCFQVAGAMAAILLLGFVALSLRTRPETPFPIATAPPQRALAPAPIPRRIPARRNLDRRPDKFPSPAPLTTEERTLLALIRSAPETIKMASAAIEIPPIQIPPLQSDGSQ